MPRKQKNRGYVGRFSGHFYASARGLGDYQWEPQAETKLLLGVIISILAANAAYLPLRPRAILYRLMGIRKATKKDDGKITDILINARRAGLLDIPVRYTDGTTGIMSGWDAIDDGRTLIEEPGGYDHPVDYWEAVERGVEQRYRRQLRQGQKWWIELWVESAGYLPVLKRTAMAYGARMISGSGFNPVLEIRKSALAAWDRWIEDDQRTLILLLGDRDEAGITRMDRTDADMREFLFHHLVAEELEERGIVELDEWDEDLLRQMVEDAIKSVWIGLRPEQVLELHLLDENGKETETEADLVDGDGREKKFELEAVPPATVVGWVEQALKEHTDEKILAQTINKATDEREKMGRSIKNLTKRWRGMKETA